jgi:hypothetical protein
VAVVGLPRLLSIIGPRCLGRRWTWVYDRCNEDGPEAAEGNYEFDGLVHELDEREIQVWSLRSPEGVYLGDVVAEEVIGQAGSRYTVWFDDDDEPEDEYVEEWMAALEYLISESATS